MMYYGYTIPELIVFGLAGVLILWSLFRIITVSRHDPKFLYYFTFVATCLALWAWRSGVAFETYSMVKHWIGTPDW